MVWKKCFRQAPRQGVGTPEGQGVLRRRADQTGGGGSGGVQDTPGLAQEARRGGLNWVIPEGEDPILHYQGAIYQTRMVSWTEFSILSSQIDDLNDHLMELRRRVQELEDALDALRD